jgi:hypothetical protein
MTAVSLIFRGSKNDLPYLIAIVLCGDADKTLYKDVEDSFRRDTSRI